MTQTTTGRSSSGLGILSGVESSVFGQAVVLVAGLTLTPHVVRGLGADAYGLFTLMWTALAFLMLLNGGTIMATQKYAAEYKGLGEPPGLARLLRRVFYFQSAMGLIGAALLLVGKHWLVDHWLNLAGGIKDEALLTLAFTAAAAPAHFMLSFAMNVLYGTQRFSAYNAFLALQTLLVLVAAVAILACGYGLPDVAVAFTVINWGLAVAALWLVRSLWSKPSAPDRRLKEFATFSMKAAVTQFMWLAVNQGDRVFIAGLLPVSAVGYYSVSVSIAQKFNAFCGTVSSVVFPFFSELAGIGDEERTRELYFKATELSLFLILPVSILSFVLIPQFMTLWLGEDFGMRCTWPFRLMVLANLAYLFSTLPNALAAGRGAPQLTGYMNAGKLLLLAFLWPWLIPYKGISGAALGTLVAEWLMTPLFLGYIHTAILPVSLGTFLRRACLRPAAAGIILAGLGALVRSSISNWPELIGAGVGLGLTYLALAYAFLDAGGKDLLRRWIYAKFPALMR